MVELDIYYKFVFPKPEEEQKYHYYYFCEPKEEENYIQLTRKDIEEILIDDDVEIPKNIKIEYDLIKNDEKKEPNYKQFDEKNGVKIMDLNSKYKLYLKFEENYANNINKIEEKEKEKEELQKQNEEIKIILEELTEIRKKIKDQKIQINAEKNSIIKSVNYNTIYNTLQYYLQYYLH